MTIAMLALAGLPGTAGFIGKFFLIEAAVDGDFTWLGVMIVIGTMLSLAYYLRVIATIWMQPSAAVEPHVLPAMAGGSPRLTPHLSRPHAVNRVAGSPVAVICAAGSIFFGIVPSPLLDLAANTVEETLVIR